MARRVSAEKCRTCKLPILVGLDYDWCALTVRVDPRPVTASGELLAVVLGLRTYWLRGGKLDKREWWHIKDRTGGLSPGPIVVEHRCDGTGNDIPRIQPQPIQTRDDETEEVPY